MANRIEIDTQTMEEISAYFNKLSNQLEEISSSMEGAISYTKKVGPENGDIVNRLNNARRQLQSSVSHASRVGRNTMTAASMWVSTEKGIIAKLPGGKAPDPMRGENGDAGDAEDGIGKLNGNGIAPGVEKGNWVSEWLTAFQQNKDSLNHQIRRMITPINLIESWLEIGKIIRTLSQGEDYISGNKIGRAHV